MNNVMVKNGYNKIARQYLINREGLKSAKYIHLLLKYLPKRSMILDLGCGAGVPVDDLLLKSGHEVIGIDISNEQIKLARQYCKGGEYLEGDISNLKMNEYKVDAIVSFYTIFHIERSKHSGIFKTLGSYLHKDGLLLVTMGDREFEGRHLLYGEEMWSSQYGTLRNHQIVCEAGFEVLLDEIDTSGGERHQIILARKI